MLPNLPGDQQNPTWAWGPVDEDQEHRWLCGEVTCISNRVEKINEEKMPYVEEQCRKMLRGLRAQGLFDQIKSISPIGGTVKGGTVGGQKRPSHRRSLLSKVTILILKFLKGHHRDFY